MDKIQHFSVKIGLTDYVNPFSLDEMQSVLVLGHNWADRVQFVAILDFIYWKEKNVGKIKLSLGATIYG